MPVHSKTTSLLTPRWCRQAASCGWTPDLLTTCRNGILLWLAVAGLVSLSVLVVCAGCWRAGDRVLGTCLGALAMLLASPISWSHHWVWAVPAALVLWERSRWAGAAWTTVFVARPIVWPPYSQDREYGWNPPDHLVGNAYLVAPLALTLWVAAAHNRRYRPRVHAPSETYAAALLEPRSRDATMTSSATSAAVASPRPSVVPSRSDPIAAGVGAPPAAGVLAQEDADAAVRLATVQQLSAWPGRHLDGVRGDGGQGHVKAPGTAHQPGSLASGRRPMQLDCAGRCRRGVVYRRHRGHLRDAGVDDRGGRWDTAAGRRRRSAARVHRKKCVTGRCSSSPSRTWSTFSL